MPQHISMVIAGATGLVGQATLTNALGHDSINNIYSLSRRSIEIQHNKLTQWVNAELTPPAISTIEKLVNVGVITLGSTLKKAGNKETLYAIDVDLVVKVAKHMQALGVQHLIVVSCLGASPNSRSHYLRCKGQMEMGLQQLNVKNITFLQPGPLVGRREIARIDEKILQYVMKAVNPLMIGPLANYKPIQSRDVAKVILHLATQQSELKDDGVRRINTSQMLDIIKE